MSRYARDGKHTVYKATYSSNGLSWKYFPTFKAALLSCDELYSDGDFYIDEVYVDIDKNAGRQTFSIVDILNNGLQEEFSRVRLYMPEEHMDELARIIMAYNHGFLPSDAVLEYPFEIIDNKSAVKNELYGPWRIWDWGIHPATDGPASISVRVVDMRGIMYYGFASLVNPRCYLKTYAYQFYDGIEKYLDIYGEYN